MPDHSFSKEIFPNIQSEPPLTQLEAIKPPLTQLEAISSFHLF